MIPAGGAGELQVVLPEPETLPDSGLICAVGAGELQVVSPG